MKKIDIKDIEWGYYPAPLLPKPLRLAWASQPLPGWVIEETGLLVNSTFEHLDSKVWNFLNAPLSSRMRHFLYFKFRENFSSIKDLQCFVT